MMHSRKELKQKIKDAQEQERQKSMGMTPDDVTKPEDNNVIKTNPFGQNTNNPFVAAQTNVSNT